MVDWLRFKRESARSLEARGSEPRSGRLREGLRALQGGNGHGFGACLSMESRNDSILNI